jgi:glutamate N-acetyltransferase/amino-acid N-acetyltransferase
MKIIRGGITAARGFLASGIHCGIKYKNKDLALIYSQVPCVAAGLFTQNRVKAAPVKLSKIHLRNNRAQAVIINSGNANCCVGAQGTKDSYTMCTKLAKRLGISVNDVLVASTGIIGRKLPIEKIEEKLGILVEKLSSDSGFDAACAIMTTDTKPKQVSVEIKIGRKKVRIGAIAKGAGMIHPNLATMLAFIATDVVIDRKRLKKALKEAVDNSFNLVSVEGDTSTNDTVLALANGLAGNDRLGSREFQIFQKALNFVCLKLAKMIAKDAEGATKFVEIQVEKAKNFVQAKKIAFRVASSPLVKTALYGKNPNWGRIVAVTGCADFAIREEKLSIRLDGVMVFNRGIAVRVSPQALKQVFRKREIQIRISLGLGKFSAKVFTCDLSQKYVSINAKY